MWALSVPARASFFPSQPFSSKAAGTTGAAFLKLPHGARYEALAGAAAAAAEGADALSWNPAGLARLTPASPSDLSLSYNALLEGSYAGGLSYARPRVGAGTLGLGMTYFSQSSLTRYSTVGDAQGSFAPSDLALIGGYAAPLGRLRLGGAFKLIRQTLDDVSAMTGAADLGLQADGIADVGDGALDVGASLSNLGPPIKLGGHSAPLPASLRGGALWRASPTFNVLLDLVLPVDEEAYVALAGEAVLRQPGYSAYLRLGFNQSRTRHIEGLTGVTGGAGLDMGRFRLDYAWVPFGDLGFTNRLTLTFRFGDGGASPDRPARRPAKVTDERKLLEAVGASHAPGSVLSEVELRAAREAAGLDAPAGSAAAERLARQGRFVLLSDGHAAYLDLTEEPRDARLSAAAAAARRGAALLNSRSPLSRLEAVSVLEAAQRAYMASPALTQAEASQSRQVSQLRHAAFCEALRDVVAEFEAKVAREPRGETAAKMTELATTLRRYLERSVRPDAPAKRADRSAHEFLTVLVREYRVDGLERSPGAQNGLEIVRRALAQLR